MKRDRIARALLVRAVCAAALFASAASAQEKQRDDGNYEREELGVNSYTTPSISRIFEQLDALKPLPFDLLKREMKPLTGARREQLGLAFGSLIADGFLVVAAQKSSLVEELGRSLLKEAQSLGVAERVIRHSKSLTELGQRGDWPAVRGELTATQADVEAAMIQLHDQKMAHFISLGGWLRGLEIGSSAVLAEFSPDRAKIIWQQDLVNYFAEELKTLPPELSADPLFVRIREGVKGIQAELNKALPGGPTTAEVKAVNDQAREINAAITLGRDHAATH
jgi:hypothetical protein